MQKAKKAKKRLWPLTLAKKLWDFNSYYFEFYGGLWPAKLLIKKIKIFFFWYIVRQRTLVRTRLPIGYYDVDAVMLHSCFSLLCDYVEGELAWEHVMMKDAPRSAYNVPWYMTVKMFIRKNSKKLGVENLDSAIKFLETDVEYSKNSLEESRAVSIEVRKKIRSLYLWWTEEYLPLWLSGELYEKMGYGDEVSKLEDKKLKELIEIRGYLWT